MHRLQRANACLASLALVGALAFGWLGGSTLRAQAQRLPLHIASMSHHFSSLISAEGGPPPGHRPFIAAEGGPPPGH